VLYPTLSEQQKHNDHNNQIAIVNHRLQDIRRALANFQLQRL